MGIKLAIVGATGAVGVLMRRVLEERNVPFDAITFLASERTAGQSLTFRGAQHQVQLLKADAFADVNFVLSSTPSGVSKEFSPIAAKAGAIVIDNSSAWRMDPQVPLVVPEVNSHELKRIPKGIVANPNCVAIPLTVALGPLHAKAKARRVVVSTYQSSSGKGAKGLADFDAQTKAFGRGEPVPAPTAHKARLAGNVLPHDWTVDDNGFTEEENKVVNETKKILGGEISVVPTCVRVPVRISHSLAVTVEFEKPISVNEALELWRTAPGVVLCDSPPVPLDVEGRDEVFVGRCRRDPTVPNGLVFWVVADNLRKGAATNAVQILQHLLSQRA